MSEKFKYYWPVDPETKEVSSKCRSQFRGGVFHFPKTALLVEPLAPKPEHAVVAIIDAEGVAIGSKYIEDNRGLTIYDESDCTNSEVITDLGPIKDGYTPDKPLTEFDERIDGKWVTNESDKYIAEYAQVDATRENLYRTQTDPLENKARRLERNGATTEELQIYYDRINELVTKIKSNNPWPVQPV